MKLPIAPESKSALTECTSLVLVVLISIGRMMDIPRAPRVLAESIRGYLEASQNTLIVSGGRVLSESNG